MIWPTNKRELFELGRKLSQEFCELNQIPRPRISLIDKSTWKHTVCAYYRVNPGIVMCLEKCAAPSKQEAGRLWSWPGSKVDRTPYGVIAHEIGHHCDVIASESKREYYGDCSSKIFVAAAEKPLTGYTTSPPEWFAEAFRLFVTNPNLLKLLRPKTYEIISLTWRPLQPDRTWREVLGDNCPNRVIQQFAKIEAQATKSKS